MKWLDLEVKTEWTEGIICIRRNISEVDGKRIPVSMLARYADAPIPIPNTTRVVRIKQTKTKRIRRIPLPTDVRGKLREHFTAQGRLKEELGMNTIDLNDWMFPKPRAPDQVWAPTAFTSCHRAFLQRRGIKPASFTDGAMPMARS